MSFAALARKAKASEASELDADRSGSTRRSHIEPSSTESNGTSDSDRDRLQLPKQNAPLPEHPSLKLKSAPTANVAKPSGASGKSAFLEAIKQQIAKEEEEEKLKIPESTASIPTLATLPTHLRTKEGTDSSGNTECVNCFSLLPNGEFASGSGDGRVLIWNEGTGEVIQILQNHKGPVLSMAITRDGRDLITGSSDMSIRKWNLAQPVISQALEYGGHTRWVQSVATHHHFVFSASLDKTVRQWDVITGKCNFIFAGHTDWVSSLCVHNDTLYTGSWDGIVRLWNINTWECTHLFEGHKGPILAICLDVTDADSSGRPSFLYSASQDGTVKGWSLQEYVQLNSYSGHVLGVSTVDCSSKYLVSGSFDSTIRIYDPYGKEALLVLYGHEDSVTCVKLSKDSMFLYSSSDDFTIRKWDCKTGVCLRIYGIPASQQKVAGRGLDGKKSASLSLLLNYGDDEDPTSLRSRVRKILREEENESILVEHEFSRRLELYRSKLKVDRMMETAQQEISQKGSIEKSTELMNKTFNEHAIEDSVVNDLKDDFQNQRYGLIAVYSDAKEVLREDVLDCAGLGATAVQLLWENKQESLKVAWLECQNATVSQRTAPDSVNASVSEADQNESDDAAAKLAASSIVSAVLDSALSLTPEGVAEGILSGILNSISDTQLGVDAHVAQAKSAQSSKAANATFNAASASIDVSDVLLHDILSPQLLACLNSILQRANRRFDRSKSLFNANFFESAMMQADDRDQRMHFLQSSMLDTEERKMLLQREETRLLALISAEAREIHMILTQVASEMDRLVSDHRKLWSFKFSGLFTADQWKQLDVAVAELITKHQLECDVVCDEFDTFVAEATAKDLPQQDIDERCEQFNDQMAAMQKRLDEELMEMLMKFDFMTPELLAQMRTIFSRDADAVMLLFKIEADRQQKRAIEDRLERQRREDIQKEELDRLAAKRVFKEKMQREAELAKIAKLKSMEALESSRTKQKFNFELELSDSKKSEDFSDLDDTGFVFLHPRDLRGRPVLILKMANFPSDPCFEGRPHFEDFEAPSEQWQRRIMRFVMHKLDSILAAPESTHEDGSRYLLVVDFTNSISSRRPSIVFLQQAWYFVPDRARVLLDECLVIDSPFWFRAFVWFMKPIVSPRVWKKVRFLRHSHELWGILSLYDISYISFTDKSGARHLAFSDVKPDDDGKPQKLSFMSIISKARTKHLIKGQDSAEFFEEYFKIINGAKVSDWTDIIDLHFLDTSSVDILGRPVIMFIASNFPCKLGDSFLNRCLVYMILRVHELMFEQNQNVSVLVICSNVTSENIPGAAWLKHAAKQFPHRIRKKIQSIYLLNPGFLLKRALWVVRSIASPKISAKIVEIETLLQLMRYFNPTDLKLPASVLQDVQFGGTPEEMKMMMADIRVALQRGHDAGLDQKVDWTQQFAHGRTAPTDHDIETFFALTYKDFEEINGKDIVKFVGRDVAKRPVISIALANIPASKGEIVMNKVFRLVVLLLQPLSQLPYSIALIASRFAASNQPSLDWMKAVHKSIDSKARKNLRAVYLFEPTFLVKSLTFGLQSFVSAKFFKKIILITDSDDFYQHFDPSHCKLPHSLTAQFIRTHVAPVVSASASVATGFTVPPQFKTISTERFADLKRRSVADFGDDFDELAEVSGVDIFGDPVLVIDGSKIGASSEDAFISTVFYLLALARENINTDETFSVVYCDDAQDDKTPSLDWLRGAYSLIPKHLRKNIKHLFCVNSTQSLRMFFWFANTFVSSKFAQKVLHVMDTADLTEYLDVQETKLPPSALQRLPQADAKKMSLAMVRRSRAIMSHQLAPKQAASAVELQPVSDDDANDSLASSLSIIDAAYAANKTAAEELNCIFVSSTLQGLPCVMIQVCALPNDQHPNYREVMKALFLLIVVTIDTAAKKNPAGNFSLFLSNVDSSSENRPSMEWLRAFHSQLPHHMRKNCSHVFVYMPSLAMRAFLGTARLFLSSKFFKKVVNLNSESAAQQHFNITTREFMIVSGKIDLPSSDGRSRTSSRAGRTASRTQGLRPDFASESTGNDAVPLVSSNPKELQQPPEQPQQQQKLPPAQLLVTRFRNLNGKPVVRSDFVPIGQLSWATAYSAYSPTVFTSEGFPGSVRSSIRSPKNPLGQADPEDIQEVIYGLSMSAFEELRESEESIESLGVADSIASTALGRSRRLRFSHTGKLTRNEKGYPLNPTGRTGLDGRGEHFLWGPNHIAMPVIVRCSGGDRLQHVQLLMTKDVVKDSGKIEWSLPEDPVPAGHCISPQLLKGLEEQALSRVDLFDELSQEDIRAKFQNVFGPGRAAPDNVLHAGVWDALGNTDRAWTESLCVLVLLEEQLARSLDNGSQRASWVPFDPSMPIKTTHRALVSQAIQCLNQRGVCDAHGNVSSGFGGFSLSASLAGLEESISSVFAVQSFTESTIEDEQRDYEELEKNEGLYAEPTVAARRVLAARYRKAGNVRAAKALEALDRTDIAGGVDAFPKENGSSSSGGGGGGGGSADSSRGSAPPLSKDEYIATLSRAYRSRVRVGSAASVHAVHPVPARWLTLLQVETLGLHDAVTVSMRKQLCSELSNMGRFEEAAQIRSESMTYNAQ